MKGTKPGAGGLRTRTSSPRWRWYGSGRAARRPQLGSACQVRAGRHAVWGMRASPCNAQDARRDACAGCAQVHLRLRLTLACRRQACPGLRGKSHLLLQQRCMPAVQQAAHAALGALTALPARMHLHVRALHRPPALRAAALWRTRRVQQRSLPLMRLLGMLVQAAARVPLRRGR